MAHDCDVPLKEQIRDIELSAKDAWADRRISFREAMHLSDDIAHAASHVFAGLADRDNRLGELIEAAESLFDEFIEPLDIYGIPDGFERNVVDPAIRGSIRTFLTRFSSGS